MDSLPSRCFWIFFLIMVTGVLRCLETSINNASEARLQKMADSGSNGAARALKITDNPGGFYNSIRVLVVLLELITAFLGSMFLPDTFFGNFGTNTAYVLSIVSLAVLILILGVYIPKRLADLFPDEILLFSAGLLKVIYFIGLPFSAALTFISNLILLIFGIKPNDNQDEVTEEEIRMMVDIGSESGAIDPDEKEMIHNIFELDDTQIKDIMTHRTDTELLWLDETDSWKNIISETNHSIYPVCENSVDNIVGILKSKDFFKTLLNNGDILSIVRTPYFVPETIKADDLFRQMQKTKNHFAVVLDEYGGLGGIITMSDLLEEIVGTLSDNFDEVDDNDIIKIDDNTWKISGSCDIDLVSETLEIDLPIEEYNTFAGMILGELGEIPDDGSTPELEAYGLQIRVTLIRDHRIESALVSCIEKVQDNK